MKLTVTSNLERGLDATISTAEELAKLGYTVVPHIGARLVLDRDHLERILGRLEDAGVRELFVIAGDAKEPLGEFSDALSVLVAVGELGHGLQEIGFVGYPEPHPFIPDDVLVQALRDKAPYASYVISQICFDPSAIDGWVRKLREDGVSLPVYVGIPGVVESERLLRISRRLGVAGVDRLEEELGESDTYAPDPLVDGVASIEDEPAAVAGFHVYTFNELAPTEAWRRRRLEELRGTRRRRRSRPNVRRRDPKRRSRRSRARARLDALPRADADPPAAEAGRAGARARARLGNGSAVATEVDAEGNVVVRVPPSAGREDGPTVVLQSHLDMVCERDPESPFDPRTGPIEVVLDDGWVAASGTTLGADNGIGVAAAMAIGEDETVEHGPLELLFTVSEEQGLEGAKALDPDLLAGRLLVNLDGGDEQGAITVGCAGSIHTFVRLALSPEPVAPGSVGLEVTLAGARGGHSGADIASGRVNAIKALGRILSHAHLETSFRLALLEGGVSRNAIPRDARAVVSLETESERSFRTSAERELAALREQFAGTDDRLTLAIEPTGAVAAADDATSSRALDLLATLPSGVIAMTPSLPGAVETSSSVTVAETSDGVLTFGSMTRSANARALDEVEATIAASARLAGAEVEVRRSYPPWEPDLTSNLLAAARRTHERVFGEAPALKVVHGGLECAVIGERIPGIEMISIGPDIRGPHAPGERLGVESTQRFYRLLGALLDDLSR